MSNYNTIILFINNVKLHPMMYYVKKYAILFKKEVDLCRSSTSPPTKELISEYILLKTLQLLSETFFATSSNSDVNQYGKMKRDTLCNRIV